MKKNNLVILHIGYCPDNKASGVAVAIPNHLVHQAKLSQLKIGFLNLCDNRNLNLKNVSIFSFEKYKNLKSLPEPFSSPNLIVFHEIYRTPFLNLSKEAKSKKIPYVIIPHGGLTNGAQKQSFLKKKLGNILLFNNYIYSAAAIQFLSLSEKERSKRFIKNQYIIVSGSGVVIPDVKYKVHNHLKFVFIGRYDIYYKGLDVLLPSVYKIAKDLEKESVTIELYGVGNKKDENYIKTYLEKHNMSKICKVNGPIFGKDKDLVLSNTDIFIQPSRSEGQPLGIIEALSYGIPVIVTPGTGMADDAKKYNFGYAVDFDVDELSKTILFAVSKRDKLYILSKNARKFAKTNFDWIEIEKNLLKEYYNVLRRI